MSNRRMRRLLKRQGVKKKQNNDSIELKFETPMQFKITEIAYDENGGESGFYIGLFDGEEKVDIEEFFNASEELPNEL